MSAPLPPCWLNNTRQKDLPEATPLATVADKLQLSGMRGRQWHVQGTCNAARVGC